MGELQIVVFSLNNQFCGADTSQVQEIIKYREAARVPRLPRFVDGIINLRGKVIPIIDLNKRFEIGDTEITRKTKIVVTQIRENQVGYMVNDVVEILKFSDEEMELPPDAIFNMGNSYVKSIGKKGDSLITILDLEKILTENEAKRLKIKEKSV